MINIENETTLKNKSFTKYEIKVLLIDDQPIVASAVKMMLASEKDITFYYCQDPTKAVARAVELNPTVILQDLVMPDIDGLTLVKFFRANPVVKDVPLIVLSSKEEASTKADSFAAGANDYLVKLPDRIELIARIRYHSKAFINLLQRNEMYEALLKSQKALALELKRAAEYVISLLPEPVTSGSIKTQWKYVPSADLGGDSFGYHWIDENHFALYLLDVCDHGVGPALLSVSALNVLRSQTLPDTDFRNPVEVLNSLNSTFVMEKQNNLYFTLWYGVYNKATQILTYGSAGHPPAILFANGKEPKDLITKNLILGHLETFPYKSASVKIDAPAELFIFSDGAYEVQKADNSMWSHEELKEFFLSLEAGDKDELDKLYNFLIKLNGNKGLDDDFSIMKITFE